MFDLEGIECPIELANYQRNSRLSVTVNCTGKLSWMKEFSEADEDFSLVPRAVLIKGDNIGILSTDNLLVYRTNGSFDYMLPLGSGTPVVFGGKAVAYLEPAYLLNYRDYSRKLILESGEFPTADKWSYILFFTPKNKDFMAVVQFTGGPRPAAPPEFDIFRKQIEKSRVSLRYRENGTIERAMLTTDHQKIVVLQGPKVSLINAADIQVESSFDLGFEEIENASLDPANNLVFVGWGAPNKGDRPYLTKVDLSGKKLWEYQLHAPQTQQPPVCGGEGQVYVVASDHLNRISAGKLEWKLPLKGSGDVLMTVTKDDSVIILQEGQLTVVDNSGNERFSIRITEEQEYFDAPPSVDSKGRIYISSDQKLYCFE